MMAMALNSKAMALVAAGVTVAGDKGEAVASVMFDTGAHDSFISRALAERIATVVKLAQPIDFTLGDNSNMTVTHTAIVSLRIGSQTITDNFMVSDGLVHEVILGASTLRKYQMKIDMGRDAVLANITHESGRKESFMKEFLKKLFSTLGIKESEEVNEDKAIELIKEKAIETKDINLAKIVAAPGVLALLELKAEATEAEVKGKILALKSPGNVVPREEYETLLAKMHEQEIEQVVNNAIAVEGKLYAHEREWALTEAKKDIDTFKAFVSNRPKVVPIKTQLPKKKDDKTLGAIDETQAEINRQLGISEETFKKYNASAN